ncbi:ATP synthase F1 subcomplex gamma subunit [Saccharopolyspora erythraea NRRL 2338]|uniref:ATP synthase gamma chain n=2 Tax=Saccharopolyspora erythraea TaxID=1836 RepID=ATPG_SACEN|nr:F0F1 ATP synthase subunit gamma [Saccharopolyspora erythraea]A4FN28.1 RecName: Full=ATP synthase gamma chain; AltName: Full=ATP synthase F1 sector gamma subunit; AltName: Full=F-ATPase gamma subunit [Saccharopolyspora erythraea NRRL 2338]EQD81515.1 F0F1 ATP synthase subunit gamma [Saccharopolyspora erythraea D]PFG99094.1 ATP synthase F1 subcomplex gamma subunit [Saccharopolyspora erythraea NRRL 2338]QRK89055.1 F0F1 ATP synthase subunit gamma [Saccharopolyspora erythraea]CAM05453.1 ATP synth
MAQLRELRNRIRSVKSTRKITKAQELIATSRIMKAQARVEASRPYADEITNVLTALADASTLDHPLLTERENPKRAGVLVVTSDRGFCGGYNANVLRAAEELQTLLREQGKTPVLYVVGRKGEAYYRFRQREIAKSWTGFTDRPDYSDAADIGETLVKAFLAGADDYLDDGGPDGTLGVDELHLVHTEFVSMITQKPSVKRVAPLEVEYSEEPQKTLRPVYDFEPDADTLFKALLPKYINTRLFAGLLDAAASEHAARRTAMKSATDNADEIIRTLSREANQARQAQITQEISEIVGGVEALSSAGSE